MASEFMEDFLNRDGDAAANDAASAGTAMKDRVIDVLQTIYDPEIPVNLYELGLIYDVEVDHDSNVRIVMTLTTPMCPVAESMPGEVEMRVAEIDGIGDVTVELTWDPPWEPGRMSESAKLELGLL